MGLMACATWILQMRQTKTWSQSIPLSGIDLQWWSLETWSQSRDSCRDKFLRVLVSVSKVSGLDTLHIAKKWFIKIFIIQRFLFVVFAGKKQSEHFGKMPEIWKEKSSQKWWCFFSIRQNAQILESRVSVSNFKSWVLVPFSRFLTKSWSRLEILTRSRPRSGRLRFRLHHCWFATKPTKLYNAEVLLFTCFYNARNNSHMNICRWWLLCI